MKKKAIFLGLAVVLGTTTAIFAAQEQDELSEACSGDTTRCITRGNGDVIWGDWSSEEEDLN